MCILANMKTTLTKLAKYNAAANRKMLGVLSTLSSEQLNHPAGSYFGSILSLLNHLLKSDIGWLQRLHNANNEIKSLDTPLLELPRALAFTENLFNEFEPLRQRRYDVDDIFIALVNESTEEYLETRERYVNRRGETEIRRPGDVLLHLFNHQTHHRGAISQVLDTLSVENDYSSFMSTLEQ